MIHHIRAIFWKQLKDMVRNKTILIQFVLFPCLAIIMENTIQIPDMQEHFFTNLFAVMYVGMAPLTSMAAIIAEEKEKNTLCVLQMCNVKASEYLIGNAAYIIAMCMVGALAMGLVGGYQGRELMIFMALMLIGHCSSLFLGAAIGVISKNQMAATSLTVPVIMFFSFLPMISMFNEKVRQFSKYVFGEQLYLLMNQAGRVTVEAGLILAGNIVLAAGLFGVAYLNCNRLY